LLIQPLENPIIPTGVKPAPPTFIRELYFSTIHGLIFSVTAIIWTWTLNKHFSLRTAMGLSVGCLFVYGVMTEFIQALTPGRAPQPTDVLANTLGAGIGAWILYHWIRWLIQTLTPKIHFS
jgi:VanZ family protein